MSSYQSAQDLLTDLNVTAPYVSFGARFATYKGFMYDKSFSSVCTSEKLARAGFYSTATAESPTSSTCPFCKLELTFSSSDDPWMKHCAERPGCEYVMLGNSNENEKSLRTIVNLALHCATVTKYEELLEDMKVLGDRTAANVNYLRSHQATRHLISLRNAAIFLTYEHRLVSFESAKMKNKKILKGTMKKVAQAGFYSTATVASPSSASCPFCLLEIDLDNVTDFWAEHQKNGSGCAFVKLGKLKEEDWNSDDALMLAVRIAIMKKYQKGLKLVEKIEKNDEETQNISEELSRILEPKLMRRRCSV